MSRRTTSLVIWILGDFLLFVGAYALSYFLRVGFIFSSEFPIERFLTVSLLVAPVWLATLLGTRTFALMRRQRSLRVAGYLAYASVGAAALFVLTYYFLYGVFFSRLLLVCAIILTFLCSWVWHLGWESVMRAWLRSGKPSFPTLIVGVTREAAELIRSLQQNKSPLKPVAILDARGAKEKEIEGVPVEGKLNKLEETLATHGITHLIQCADLEQNINLLSACRQRGISYLLLPSVLGITERDERVDTLERRPVTVVRPKGTSWNWFFN